MFLQSIGIFPPNPHNITAQESNIDVFAVVRTLSLVLLTLYMDFLIVLQQHIHWLLRAHHLEVEVREEVMLPELEI